jgi:hypothetical protein
MFKKSNYICFEELGNKTKHPTAINTAYQSGNKTAYVSSFVVIKILVGKTLVMPPGFFFFFFAFSLFFR